MNSFIDIVNKKYDSPINIPETKVHYYQKILKTNYMNYLEVIYLCGGVCFFEQFHNLILYFNREFLLTSATCKKGNDIINRLEQWGFVKICSAGKRKYFLLKRPTIAILKGDYDIAVEYSRTKTTTQMIKGVMRLDYFLKTGNLISYQNMFHQLMNITLMIKEKIIESKNKFGYNINLIDEILNCKDFDSVKSVIESNDEGLDIVATIWRDMGLIYKKMIMQNQTVSDEPRYLKLLVDNYGKVYLKYFPEIIIVDDLHEASYYRDYLELMNYKFINIKDNFLINVQKEFQKNKELKMLNHSIGYSILVIGNSSFSIENKKDMINKYLDKGINVHSPMIDYCKSVALDSREKYFTTVMRSDSDEKKKADLDIDKQIKRQMI